MEAGKLPHEFMRDLLKRSTKTSDPRVMSRAAIGDDAAVIDMGAYCMVTKMDPITMLGNLDHLGHYLVNINANDLVTKGAEPRWFQATLLFPVGMSKARIEKIFYDLKEACDKMGVSLIGGHTEVTHAVSRPVAIGSMFGEVLKENLVSMDTVEEGDDLILVKGIAIEATTLIATEKGDLLREKGLDDAFISRCKEFLHDPGINASVPAVAAFKAGKVKAMHDPTEGGLGVALNELSERIGHGFKILPDRLLIYPETKKICEVLGLDPMFLLASGAMLMVCAPEETINAVRAIRNLKLEAAVIGSVTGRGDKIYLMEHGEKNELPGYRDDEILKVL